MLAVVDVDAVRYHGAAKGGVPQRHQLDDEHDEDGHERDPFHPRIFRDRTRQAVVRQRVVGGCEQLRGPPRGSAVRPFFFPPGEHNI